MRPSAQATRHRCAILASATCSSSEAGRSCTAFGRTCCGRAAFTSRSLVGIAQKAAAKRGSWPCWSTNWACGRHPMRSWHLRFRSPRSTTPRSWLAIRGVTPAGGCRTCRAGPQTAVFPTRMVFRPRTSSACRRGTTSRGPTPRRCSESLRNVSVAACQTVCGSSRARAEGLALASRAGPKQGGLAAAPTPLRRTDVSAQVGNGACRKRLAGRAAV